MSKWGKTYWIAFAENVGTVLVSALLTLLTATKITDIDPQLAWTIVGLPTILVALKALLANLQGTNPGPALVAQPEPAGKHLAAVDPPE